MDYKTTYLSDYCDAGRYSFCIADSEKEGKNVLIRYDKLEHTYSQYKVPINGEIGPKNKKPYKILTRTERGILSNRREHFYDANDTNRTNGIEWRRTGIRPQRTMFSDGKYLLLRVNKENSSEPEFVCTEVEKMTDFHKIESLTGAEIAWLYNGIIIYTWYWRDVNRYNIATGQNEVVSLKSHHVYTDGKDIYYTEENSFQHKKVRTVIQESMDGKEREVLYHFAWGNKKSLLQF